MAPLITSSLVDILSPISQRSTSSSLERREDPQYEPGSGVVSPFDINNTAMFVVFGLLGAALVCTSIWFFFIAKNGGFRFRKGDWSEYKSTVLRRKGPNGTLLSGATPSTNLGGGSVVGSSGSMSEFTDEKADVEAAAGKGKQNRFRRNKNKNDNDVRAYRSEKVAKVGGLNRESDGVYHDYTGTDMSSMSGSAPIPPKSGIRGGGGASKKDRVGRQFSYNAGTEATFSVASDDSHRPLTQSSPFNNRHSNNNSPRHSQSPSKMASGYGGGARYSARDSSYADPLDFESRHDTASEQTRHTKTYHHPIPGLTKGANAGYRRGRRDSLDDSDGDTRR